MQRISDWMLNKQALSALVPLVQERTERLSDLVGQVDYLLGDRRREQVVLVLDHALREFDAMRRWERDDLFARCKALADGLSLKIREFLFPLFVAVSGREVSLPLFDSLVFLGPDVTRMRIRDALAVLGVSRKESKRLEKRYQEYLSTRP
jgi:glutamyl-tRNA synthetase